MKSNGWHVVVRVDGEFYAVLPKNAAPPDQQPGQLDNDPHRKGTITQGYTKLGMRKADTFGAGYERMGVEVATHICNTHDSIEQYVKLNLGYLD